jgi:preprotein translocase subunit YajC
MNSFSAFLIAQAPVAAESSPASAPVAPAVDGSAPPAIEAAPAELAAPDADWLGTTAHTEQATPAAEEGAAQAAPNPLGQFMPLILIVVIFYFLMIRPQQRKDKERRKQIDELRAGTRVLFSGGMIGMITEVKDATFMVEIATGTVVEIARGAVNQVLKDGQVAKVDDAR